MAAAAAAAAFQWREMSRTIVAKRARLRACERAPIAQPCRPLGSDRIGAPGRSMAQAIAEPKQLESGRELETIGALDCFEGAQLESSADYWRVERLAWRNVRRALASSRPT